MIINQYYKKLFKQIDGVVLTGHKEDEEELTIPEEMNGKRVVSVDKDTFKDDRAIKKLRIGSNVNNISSKAFFNCVNIEAIDGGEGILTIEERAFSLCTRLKSIDLRSVQNIGPGAFRKCFGLKEVQLGSDCQEIAEDAFAECPDLLIRVPAGSKAEELVKTYGWNYSEY